ncbi:MAG: TetR/AcrR family transcriptional regulator [Acidimicrobiales bacterium]
MRRSQSERSTATQRALLDVTVDCLVESGFHRLTQVDVAGRAGLSVGALAHHFPSKSALLAAAVDHLLVRRQSEFRLAVAHLDPGADRLAAAIDALWASYGGSTFVAWAELWVAARTDPELAVAMAKVDRTFLDTSETLFDEALPAQDGFDDPRLRRVPLHSVLALMGGLALSQLVPGYQPYRPSDVLDAYKAMASLTLAAITQSRSLP